MLAYFMAADPAADGWFRTAVITTGIYCRPSCRARKPHARNVLFFRTGAEAREAGFRACRRCHPDEAGDDFVARVAAFVEGCDDVPSVGDAAIALGLSPRQLQRCARQAAGCTPKALIDRLVLARAVRLLGDARLRVIDVGMQCGYQSVSAFNRAFRQAFGVSAAEFRRLDPRSKEESR
jgi:methylphosphotriester-DNA--protein-cysteine methyltransferase